MATYNAGVLISELRKQRGISQEKLADGICDRRTLSYIENGKISPSKFIFEKIMERLGVNPARFSNYISSNAEMKFDFYKMKINQFLKISAFKEAEESLLALENDESLRENIFVKQYILLMNIWVESRNGNWDFVNKEKAFESLYTAIRLTVPNFDESKIKGNLYSLDELNIIRTLAINFLFSDQKEKSITIYQDLFELTQTNYLFEQDLAPFFNMIASGYAKNLRWLGRYEEALEVCEKGFEMSAKYNEYSNFPWLMYQKASALYYLDRKEESKEIFIDCLHFHGYYKNDELIEFVQERMIQLGLIETNKKMTQ